MWPSMHGTLLDPIMPEGRLSSEQCGCWQKKPISADPGSKLQAGQQRGRGGAVKATGGPRHIRWQPHLGFQLCPHLKCSGLSHLPEPVL